MDIINIENLRVYAYHGVFDFEKEKGQDFYISASIFLDLYKAAASDLVDNTINYADVCADISELVRTNKFDLIETVAEKIAVMILNKYKEVGEIIITVSKPNAPVDMEFENISVTIKRKRHISYIAYGSNLGDSEKIIEDAINKIDKSDCCKVLKRSSNYKSKPYGGIEQPDFVNGAIEIETYLEPLNLLGFLNEIETDFDRKREVHWGPRTLDLDIIFFDDMVISSEALSVPHLEMSKRDFVLKPLEEIAGYKMHPVFNKTVSELLKELDEKYIIS